MHLLLLLFALISQAITLEAAQKTTTTLINPEDLNDASAINNTVLPPCFTRTSDNGLDLLINDASLPLIRDLALVEPERYQALTQQLTDLTCEGDAAAEFVNNREDFGFKREKSLHSCVNEMIAQHSEYTEYLQQQLGSLTASSKSTNDVLEPIPWIENGVNLKFNLERPFPAGIENCNIRSLTFKNCGMAQINPDISKLQNLQALRIERCPHLLTIPTLPPHIKQVVIIGGDFTRLPEAITEHPGIERLTIRDNNIFVFNNLPGNLKELILDESLYNINKNWIQEIVQRQRMHLKIYLKKAPKK